MWNNPTAAFIAAAVVVVLVSGAAYSRFGARPKPLTDQDVLVLADFTNTTGDAAFDGALRQALAFELERSPFLKVMDDEEVNQTLKLMGRAPGERITNDIAHDVCVREGQKATIGGSDREPGHDLRDQRCRPSIVRPAPRWLASKLKRKTRSTCSKRWPGRRRGCGPSSGSR